MAIFSKIGQKSRFPEPPGGGFTSTPRAGAPRFPGRGFWTPGQAGRDSDLPGPFSGPLGTLVPGPPPGNRGAPARGVDVKPPSRGRRARGPGPSGTLRDPPLGARGPWSRAPGSRDPGRFPDLVPRSSGQGLGDPPGLPGVPRPLPRRGFYINPSRRGPAVPAGVSREFLRRHVAWSHSWPPRALRVS